MRPSLTKDNPAKHIRKAACVLLLLLGLGFLVGCQGFSSTSNKSTNVQAQSGTLSLMGTSLDFGAVSVGASKTLTMTLSNTGTASVTVSSASISSQYFSFSAPSLPVTIPAGQGISVSLVFSPNAAGTFNATVSIISNATNSPATFSLSGTGAAASGQLALNSSSENFGSVTVGSQSNQTVTLTNNSSSTVNISQIAVTGTGFKLSGITPPLALNAAQSTTFTVTFTPQATGNASGSVTISSNAPDPTLSLTLSGTGLAVGALGATPTSLNFGTVQTGNNQALSETVTNTGGSTVTISQVGISGAGFTMTGIAAPLTLTAGQSASFTVKFTPQSAGNASGNVTITSNASNPTLSVALSGTGISPGGLSSSPTSLGFGSVTVGSNQSLAEKVTNTGGSSVTISQVGISGAGFSVSGIATPVTLTAGQNVSFTVSFAPTSAGPASGTVTITSTASNPSLAIPLSGTAVTPGALGSSPTSLGFGSVTVGSNQSLLETVTNTGGSSVTISQVGTSGTGFSVSGVTVPITLTSGQSASFTVKFTPATAGSVSGNITVTSTASNPTLTTPLSATGVAPGALGSSPSSLSFGSVTVGSNQSVSEKLTNTGGSSVTISQVGTSGAGFSITGITPPLTLSAGQSASFTVAFAPISAGLVSGNLTITSTASTLTIPMSGTGAALGALGSAPSSLGFGSVTVGSNQSLSEKVTNTGGSSVTISQVGISGGGFSVSGITAPVTLTAGQSASFAVSFAPTSTGPVSGNLTITSTASNPTLTIPLSGTAVTAGALGSSPTSLTFGSVTVGGNQSLSETVTNTGGSSVTISQVGISGAGFSMSGVTAPLTLTSGQSASFTVTFTPASAASVGGNIAVTSTASNPMLSIPLSGTGTAVAGQLTVNPTTLGLGSVVVGTSGTSSGSLVASGANVTVSAASSNNSAFSLGGLSLPTTIAAGQSVPFTVTFSPQTTGGVTAALAFTSNAQPSTAAETLTGTGTPAPTHTVNLSWSASTSPNISGYNVYRSVYVSSCGSFAKINSSLNASTVYADSGVANGTSYCYATTAVDSSNQESAYSNTVSNVQIP